LEPHEEDGIELVFPFEVSALEQMLVQENEGESKKIKKDNMTFLATSRKKAERRKAKRRRARLKVKEKVFVGVAHVHATFTNCIVSAADLLGNVLCWSSSGQCGYKGRKKRSYYVAGAVGRDLGFKLKRQRKMKKLSVILKGPGRGRLNVIKGLARSGIQITRIVDRTPRAFNGCRPRKRRRIRGNS
jgi:small subunit ribosomal protein S11